MSESDPPAPWAPIADLPELPELPELPPGPPTWQPPPVRPLTPIGPHGFPTHGPGSIPSRARRAWARVIDTGLVFAGFAVIAATVWGHVAADGSVTMETVPVWAYAATLLFDIVYETVAVAFTGRTLGKLLLGLRVEDPIGRHPGWHRSTLRIAIPDLVFVIPVVGALLAVFGYVTATRDELGQTVYDKAAGTVVVSSR